MNKLKCIMLMFCGLFLFFPLAPLIVARLSWPAGFWTSAIFYVTLTIISYETMNQLQLFISRSADGFKTLAEVNATENVRREITACSAAVLDIVDYDPKEKKVFYILAYIHGGSIIRIIRTIPDHAPDYLEVAVFVPEELVLDGGVFGDIIDTITRKVLNAGFTREDLDELRDIFSLTYEAVPDPAVALPSEGRDYGLYSYGGTTGRGLVDVWQSLYRPEWAACPAVILLEDPLTLKNGVNAKDLGSDGLAPVVTLLPPAESPLGFVPHIFRHVFDRPYRVTLGSEVDIVWHQPGYEDIIQHFKVTADRLRPEEPSDSISRKAVSPASFLVTSRDTGEPLFDSRITVNGVEIDEARRFTVPELLNARITVEAKGYLTFKGIVDLSSNSQVAVQMQKRHKLYRFILPVSLGDSESSIKFELHTSRAITASPVDGYIVEGRIDEGEKSLNRLRRERSLRRLVTLREVIFALAGLVVGIVIMTIAMFVDGDENPATIETVVSELPVASYAEACGYLDSNKIWSRDRLEAIPGLEGLFDELNNYDFDRIVDYRGPMLSSSKSFAAVVKAARHARDKGVDPRRDPAVHAPTYNRDGDKAINWRGYTYWIDP